MKNESPFLNHPSESVRETSGQKKERIILDALKAVGEGGLTADELLPTLEPYGLVQVKVGEEVDEDADVNIKQLIEADFPKRPVYEQRSVYDSDDVTFTLIDLESKGLVRVDKATKKWFTVSR